MQRVNINFRHNQVPRLLCRNAGIALGRSGDARDAAVGRLAHRKRRSYRCSPNASDRQFAPDPGCVVPTAQPGDEAYSDPRHTIAVKTPAAPGAMCQLTMTLYRAFATTEFHSH